MLSIQNPYFGCVEIFNSVIESLFIYPIKGGKAVELKESTVHNTGLEGDRLFMLTDEEGRFLSQRKMPELARLECHVDSDLIVISKDGHKLRILRKDLNLRPRHVKVWDDEFTALDAGEDVANWLGRRFGKAIRLIIYDKNSPRIRSKTNLDFTASFADGYPILLTNTSSLEQLNSEMEQSVPMDRFRPNIVVKGLEPWLEQQAISLRIGDVDSLYLKPCIRCNVTRIDQSSGRSGGVEPLQTLVRKGEGVAIFGINAVLPSGIHLAVGQQIQWILPDQELR